jgi:hypothetical protein
MRNHESKRTDRRTFLEAGADLEAARAACPNQLNFGRLLGDVEKYRA